MKRSKHQSAISKSRGALKSEIAHLFNDDSEVYYSKTVEGLVGSSKEMVFKNLPEDARFHSSGGRYSLAFENGDVLEGVDAARRYCFVSEDFSYPGKEI